jgi:hypothetical protein
MPSLLVDCFASHRLLGEIEKPQKGQMNDKAMPTSLGMTLTKDLDWL